MAPKPILIAVLMLTLAALACSVTINLPVNEFKTGPTVSEEIAVPLLADPNEIAEIKLEFGAGRLILEPGAEDNLVSGKITYNIAEFKPVVTTTGNRVTLTQGDRKFEGLSKLTSKAINEWNLQLGNAPMELTIAAGAYQGEMELGSLALHSLHITDGASENQVAFSRPNLVEMETLLYETGASRVRLTGLANANFSQLTFKSGAGDFTLDFSGDLQRDAQVRILSGLSNVVIIVPEGMAARLSIDGALTNVNVEDDWRSSGNDYIMSGEGPELTFNVEMGAGDVHLRNR